MKLIELLRALDRHTRVSIHAFDVAKTRAHIIVGETTTEGWTSLIAEIMSADCTEYMVMDIHPLWNAQELYITCMKL